LNHYAAPSFWRCYRELPEPVRILADKQFELLNVDPDILRYTSNAWGVSTRCVSAHIIAP